MEVILKCKRVECKNYVFKGFGGWNCNQRFITINEQGKCDGYVKDCPSNIKQVRANKCKEEF